MCGRTEKIHKKLSQDNQFLSQDLNLGPPEYEVGVLTTQPRHSAISVSLCSSYTFMFIDNVSKLGNTCTAQQFLHICQKFPKYGFPNQSLPCAKIHLGLHVMCPLLFYIYNHNWNG
jgi:hypothetical protein